GRRTSRWPGRSPPWPRSAPRARQQLSAGATHSSDPVGNLSPDVQTAAPAGALVRGCRGHTGNAQRPGSGARAAHEVGPGERRALRRESWSLSSRGRSPAPHVRLMPQTRFASPEEHVLLRVGPAPLA
ncbi:unnamed protein product, partial [Gulo gulo]